MSVGMFSPFALDLVTGHVQEHASWVDPDNGRATYHLLARAVADRSGKRVTVETVSLERLGYGVVDVSLRMGSSRKYNVEISSRVGLDQAADAAIESFQS